MAGERRSRFKDNVRTSIRKHDEAAVEAAKAAPENEKPLVAEAKAENEPKPQAEETKGEGSAETKAPKKKAAKPKAASKPKEEPAPEKQEGDPFAKAEGKETKSERVNLLLKKSDKEAWTKAAKERGVSFTVFVETVVNSYLGR